MTTVVVAGALANKHRHGGSQWVRMSWAEGLARLGFEVVFVEQLHEGGDAAAFHAALAELGIEGALIGADGAVEGISRRQLHERLESSALLVNISGHLRDPDLLRRCRLRAFVDLDPGYTQIWQRQGHDVGLDGHQLARRLRPASLGRPRLRRQGPPVPAIRGAADGMRPAVPDRARPASWRRCYFRPSTT